MLGGVLSGLLPKRFLLAAIVVVVLFGAYEISRRDRFANAGERPGGGVGVAIAIAFAVGVLGGLLGHLTSGVDWNLLAAGACGAIPGAYLGARLTGRLDDAALLRVISLILVVAGLALAAEAVLG